MVIFMQDTVHFDEFLIYTMGVFMGVVMGVAMHVTK